MPRQARRSLLPGYPLHVWQRGHNKEPCFLSEADNRLYLGLLQEYSERHACAVHAYVLMGNHFHLLVSPPDIPSISRLMRDVNQVFGQYVNRKRNRTGSLWEGRFKACVVDSCSYFLTCQRYIELNPVRAGMVGEPARYPWSSYGANGEGLPSELVTAHARYVQLGPTPATRQATYRGLFRVPITEEQISRIRIAIHRNRPLGDDAFLRQLQNPHDLEAKAVLHLSQVPQLRQVPVPYLSPV